MQLPTQSFDALLWSEELEERVEFASWGPESFQPTEPEEVPSDVKWQF